MNVQDVFRLDERVVFLSSAAGHLVREMARALGHAGATLTLNSRNLNSRNLPRLEAFAAEFGRGGVERASFDIELCYGRGIDGGRRMDGLVR